MDPWGWKQWGERSEAEEGSWVGESSSLTPLAATEVHCEAGWDQAAVVPLRVPENSTRTLQTVLPVHPHPLSADTHHRPGASKTCVSTEEVVVGRAWDLGEGRNKG